MSNASTTTEQKAKERSGKTNDVLSANSTDNETSSAKKIRVRPKSPNVEQIDAHNRNSSKDKQKSTGFNMRFQVCLFDLPLI